MQGAPVVLGEDGLEVGMGNGESDPVIILRSDRFYEFAVGSSQYSEIISYVKENLDLEVQLALSNSTDCRSRILYPIELSGSELFDFHEDIRKGVMSGLLHLFRKRARTVEISQLVWNYLTKIRA